MEWNGWKDITSHFPSSNSWSRCSAKRNIPLESLSLSGSNFQLSLAPHGYVNFIKNKSHCHFFSSLFWFDEDDCRTNLVFVIVKFCFLLHNTPKLGWLANIHITIDRKGCLDLKDIQGHGEVAGYQGEQNWGEIWNLWVTRIPMVCFFFPSSKIMSWNSGNVMWSGVFNAGFIYQAFFFAPRKKNSRKTWKNSRKICLKTQGFSEKTQGNLEKLVFR